MGPLKGETVMSPVKSKAAHHAFDPADGAAYGLPYPTAAAGRQVSRYRKRTWRRKLEKRIRQRMAELGRLVP